jgi:hypothetical protein
VRVLEILFHRDREVPATEQAPVFNAVKPPPLQTRVGTTYRIRCINITLDSVSLFVRLTSGRAAKSSGETSPGIYGFTLTSARETLLASIAEPRGHP